MPATRSSARRKVDSEPAPIQVPAAPSFMSTSTVAPRFTFAPNVTPGTFSPPDGDNAAWDGSPDDSSGSRPPSPPSARPKPSHSKKRPESHIPRPPNAFILFRSDLVQRKAVPNSVESDHGSLSKIIGLCWQQLPLEERRHWERKAAQAKAEHKRLYPNYRYSPVHRAKDGTGQPIPKRKVKNQPAKDERRCKEVAELLMAGAKGAELEEAVRVLDENRTPPPPTPPEPSPVPQFTNNLISAPMPQHWFPPGPSPLALGYRRTSSAPIPEYHPLAQAQYRDTGIPRAPSPPSFAHFNAQGFGGMGSGLARRGSVYPSGSMTPPPDMFSVHQMSSNFPRGSISGGMGNNIFRNGTNFFGPNAGQSFFSDYSFPPTDGEVSSPYDQSAFSLDPSLQTSLSPLAAVSSSIPSAMSSSSLQGWANIESAPSPESSLLPSSLPSPPPPAPAPVHQSSAITPAIIDQLSHFDLTAHSNQTPATEQPHEPWHPAPAVVDADPLNMFSREYQYAPNATGVESHHHDLYVSNPLLFETSAKGVIGVPLAPGDAERDLEAYNAGLRALPQY